MYIGAMSSPAQRLLDRKIAGYVPRNGATVYPLVQPSDLAPPLTTTLYKVQRGACFHCGKQMTAHSWSLNVQNGWTREHVIPSAAGGTSYLNVVLAHQRCNNLRADAPLPLSELSRARTIILAAAIWRKRRGLNDGVGMGIGQQRFRPL